MTEHPSPPTPASRVSAFTLANGLRVCLREDHRAPLVSVQLWYHVVPATSPKAIPAFRMPLNICCSKAAANWLAANTPPS